ncbi:MAG TPA: hypothetical protein VNE16_13000 [Vicinamibacterales bacterium]|nr:hypothetical protein [Vicinamibacterales bacterium]
MQGARWLVLWSVILILLVTIPIVIVFWRSNRMPPEEIIRRRYARGEIDREAYERMLEDLRQDRTKPPETPRP